MARDPSVGVLQAAPVPAGRRLLPRRARPVRRSPTPTPILFVQARPHPASEVILEPVYATLATRLRRDIANGTLAPGAYLPSEATLQREQNVSRGTVRRAIDELIGEGLVISLNGRGHQVRQSMPLVWMASDPERNNGSDAGPSDVWSRSVRAQGYEPSEEIRTEIGYANESVARWLHLDPGEPVSIRRRLRFVNELPYSIVDSYYPRSIVAGTR